MRGCPNVTKKQKKTVTKAKKQHDLKTLHTTSFFIVKKWGSKYFDFYNYVYIFVPWAQKELKPPRNVPVLMFCCSNPWLPVFLLFYDEILGYFSVLCYLRNWIGIHYHEIYSILWKIIENKISLCVSGTQIWLITCSKLRIKCHMCWALLWW